MNKKEREQFLRTLIKNCKADLLKDNKKYPDNWDGHELRQRVKDVFGQVVWKGTEMTGSRKRDYNNEVIVKGLI